ncbi:MAG: clostripain-related cysteine peptidase [Pyrinomonadaceae bacterium]
MNPSNDSVEQTVIVGNSKDASPASAKNRWTVMVYLSGDSNLNVEMAYTLEQIRSITKTNDNISIYVYFDGFSEDVPTMYCDFSQNNAEFFQSRHIKDKLLTYAANDTDLNENSAAVNNVVNFVDWCVKKDRYYTIDDASVVDRRSETNYAIIFSGHSFGFMDWGLFKDQKANYTMSLSKLAWMFERVTDSEATLKQKAERDQLTGAKKGFKPWSKGKYTERTTEILGKPFALLGFDSCVLSTLEISSQFEGLAETIVSSEGSVPTAGWNYAQILLGKIDDGTITDPKAIAVSFVDEFIKKQSNFALADSSADMSAWDLTALPALKTAFGAWASALYDCFEDKRSVEYNQLRRLLTFVHWQCQTYLLEQHVDLGDLCLLLIDELDLLESEIATSSFNKLGIVRDACKQVVAEIRNVIILTGFSGRDYQFSNGISIFFPWSWESFKCAEKDYRKLLINRGNRSSDVQNIAGKTWITFLEKYLRDVTFRPARELTPIDSNGMSIIVPGTTKSVVYESYKMIGANTDSKGSDTVIDGKVEPNTMKIEPNTMKVEPNTMKVEPNTMKVEPNTMKVEPNTMKVEPNTMKMATVVGLLLSHFGAVKNTGSNWNRTGFTSTQVNFEAMPAQTRPSGENEIAIPSAIEIKA